MKPDLLKEDIVLNKTTANKHVTKIEINNRVVKERTCSFFAALSFKIVPRPMEKAILYKCTKLMNVFPHKSDITKYGPRMLLNGNPIYVKLHVCVPLGIYCQINDKPDPSNINTPRTTGSISLHSQGNLQGGYNVLTLNTWKIVQRRKWPSLPMPREVILGVERNSRKQQYIATDDQIPEQCVFRCAEKSIILDEFNPQPNILPDQGADIVVNDETLAP